MQKSDVDLVFLNKILIWCRTVNCVVWRFIAYDGNCGEYSWYSVAFRLAEVEQKLT